MGESHFAHLLVMDLYDRKSILQYIDLRFYLNNGNYTLEGSILSCTINPPLFVFVNIVFNLFLSTQVIPDFTKIGGVKIKYSLHREAKS